MKTLTIEMQLSLFAAAGTAFAAVKRLDPPDPKALAAAGLLAAALAPTYEEFSVHMVAQGRPMPDPKAYAEMLASAQAFAATVAGLRETQH